MSTERAHELIARYVKVKKPIQEAVDSFYATHLEGSYVIGIHFRGTDKKTEAPIVQYNVVYTHINNILINAQKEHGNNIKLFLATDDQHFLNDLQKKYPNKVYAVDTLRSSNGNAMHTSNGSAPYEKGKSAVVDALLLSKSDFLIKSPSNLSDSSLMFNPTIPYIRLNNEYSRG